MKPVRTFISIPALPEPLEPMREIAFNFRWAWHHDTIELFRRLDAQLWEDCKHNPILMLGSIEQEKLITASKDQGFVAHLNRVVTDLREYMKGETSWFQRKYGVTKEPVVAYFSAEFGITDCLSIFAGGLGVLAGDHLKSASDLGIPLVAVGLLYQQGYFQQYLNEAGWQQESYEINDFHNLPITLITEEDGTPILIEMPMADRNIKAQLWSVQVGTVKLYLLDTNIKSNRVEDRKITDQLYGGDTEMRMKQEIVLGIGGYRALKKLNINPSVYHMNEGHSSFLALEKTRCFVETENLSFDEAKELASAGLVFTTHTPVAAGHDYFTADQVDRYLGDYAKAFGLSKKAFMALGRQNSNDDNELFCMTILAVRFASYCNGVSKLHGSVSRKMWQGLFPSLPEDEIPIGHITNGVHFESWISQEIKDLYDRYLGPRWREEPAEQSVWQCAHQIAAEELWRSHERRRERLVSFSRSYLQQQLRRRGASKVEFESAGEVLNPEVLTIGFARRFATYKRATLLFEDIERIESIVNNPDMPIQFIFAGKAHPHDEPGKALIQKIIHLSRLPEFRNRFVFLENYNMHIARYLVQGADVWLNTPMRPREASGTSGMKAAANGVLNLSILDGWWDEAYTPEVGWAIGRKEVYEDMDYQNQIEAEALYDLLEKEVAPAFYDRGSDGLPRRWIDLMKGDIEYLCHFFNTHRMVSDYTQDFYLNAAKRYKILASDGYSKVKGLTQWRKRLQENWSAIKIKDIKDASFKEIEVGNTFDIAARIHMGALTPDDVQVEIYMGPISPEGNIENGMRVPMQFMEQNKDDYIYHAKAVACEKSGKHGYTIRVLPHHEDIHNPFFEGLIQWA